MEEEVAVKFPASVVEDTVSAASATVVLCELRQHQPETCSVRCLLSEMRSARAANGTARLRQPPANNIDATDTELIFSNYSFAYRIEVGFEFLKIVSLVLGSNLEPDSG